MTLRIFRAVAAVAVEFIVWSLEDLRPGLLRPREMFIHVADVDVQTLCRLSEPLRVFVLRAGASHHDDIVAELHRCVKNLAVRSRHSWAVLSETESLGKKLQSPADIFIQQVGCDGHLSKPPFKSSRFLATFAPCWRRRLLSR